MRGALRAMNNAQNILISAIALVLVIILSSLGGRITALEQTIEELQHAKSTN